MPIDTRRRRPGYDEQIEQHAFLWKSYAGGVEYAPEEFLDMYPRELQYQYGARQERAYHLNFVAAVVDAYIATIFRRAPVRDIPPASEEFVA